MYFKNCIPFHKKTVFLSVIQFFSNFPTFAFMFHILCRQFNVQDKTRELKNTADTSSYG